MAFIKRNWTAQEADEWTKEDWIAIVLSPLSYIFITMGLAMVFFLLPIGFILLVIGVACAVMMFWVMNPKLNAISTDYEKKQKSYLDELEDIQRWEERK